MTQKVYIRKYDHVDSETLMEYPAIIYWSSLGVWIFLDIYRSKRKRNYVFDKCVCGEISFRDAFYDSLSINSQIVSDNHKRLMRSKLNIEPPNPTNAFVVVEISDLDSDFAMRAFFL